MSDNIYEYIKERITARQAAELYGFEVNRHGMMCCPFHQDRHPSAKADERFHCFVCGIDDDAIGFTSRLFSLSSYEAAKKLAADFGVSFPDQHFKKRPNPRPAEPLRVAPVWLLDMAADRLYDYYCRLFRYIYKWLLENKDVSLDMELRPYYVAVIQFKESIEDVLDVLLYGSPKEKERIVMTIGEEVNVLEQRIAKLEAGERKGVL